MNLTRALGSVGGLTLASRVLGLVRDSLFARFIGASFASDAFLVAFRLPNMFRALFAEGAFSAAFIPMFTPRYPARAVTNSATTKETINNSATRQFDKASSARRTLP